MNKNLESPRTRLSQKTIFFQSKHASKRAVSYAAGTNPLSMFFS